jgi:hypothetical protein
MIERTRYEYVTVNGMQAAVPAGCPVAVLARLCRQRLGPGVLVRIREGEYAWGEPLTVPSAEWASALAGTAGGRSMIEQIERLASRFAGFSLEKRREWTQGPWRCRILPNKAERQDYRIEAYAATAAEAVQAAEAALAEAKARTQAAYPMGRGQEQP